MSAVEKKPSSRGRAQSADGGVATLNRTVREELPEKVFSGHAEEVTVQAEAAVLGKAS